MAPPPCLIENASLPWLYHTGRTAAQRRPIGIRMRILKRFRLIETDRAAVKRNSSSYPMLKETFADGFQAMNPPRLVSAGHIPKSKRILCKPRLANLMLPETRSLWCPWVLNFQTPAAMITCSYKTRFSWDSLLKPGDDPFFTI